MKLVGSYPTQIEQPSPVDVEAAMNLLLKAGYEEIRLVETESDWIRAFWADGIGIKVEHREPATGRVFEDTRIFLGSRELRPLLVSYAKGNPTWRRTGNWHPVDKGPSFKRILEITIWTIRLGGVAVLLATLLLGLLTSIVSGRNSSNESSDVFWAFLMFVGGLTAMSWSVVQFVYRRKDNVPTLIGEDALFPFSFLFLVAAVIALM